MLYEEEIVDTCLDPSTSQVSNAYGDQFISGNARVINGNVSLVVKRKSTLETDTRSSILDWLSPLTFRQTHEEIRDKIIHQDHCPEARRSGDYSGKWLLESEVFDQWRSREVRKLWYHGMRQ